MTLPRAWENPGQPLTVDEAQERIVASIDVLPVRAVPLAEAVGLVVASDVVAEDDVPPYANSAMDGYALRSADTLAGGATRLSVVTTIPAGTLPKAGLGPGEAARIMTGARIPEGADAVIRFEETDESALATASTVTVPRIVPAGENIRIAGESIQRGSVAIPARTIIGPIEIGVLASLGVHDVSVHRKPVVGVLSTGDEIAEPGSKRRPGQLFDSNAPMLWALIQQAGGLPRMLGVAGDDPADIAARLTSEPNLDALITSGGVSVGEFDSLKDVLRQTGHVDFWQVRMKPGRPLALGTIGRVPLLGLPGNPMAAQVAFQQFGRPLIRRLLGRSDLFLPEVSALLEGSISNPGDRRHFVRGNVRNDGHVTKVRPFAVGGAGVLSAGLGVNCYIVADPGEHRVAGDVVRVQLFDSH